MGKFIDLTGQRFGKWLVLKRVESTKNRETQYLCRCDCGTERVVLAHSLRRGQSTSCGCQHLLDLIGKRFDRLLVIKEVEPKTNKNGRKTRYFLCKCDCGNEKIVQGRHLVSGKIRSCGCFMRECTIKKNTTHGKTNTRLFRIWGGMKARCYNQNYHDYKGYGAKGTKICDEWLHDFEAFYSWSIENGYDDTLSIDRIDNSKGYSPENCRWATTQEQANNRNVNIYVTYKDEKMTVSELARRFNLNRQKLSSLVKSGIAIDEILEQCGVNSQG